VDRSTLVAAMSARLPAVPDAVLQISGGAGVGTPTLDGLGAVGGGAHADHEHVLVDALPGRAALLAALIDDVLAGGIAAEALATEGHA
jgi:hypothetical protein